MRDQLILLAIGACAAPAAALAAAAPGMPVAGAAALGPAPVRQTLLDQARRWSAQNRDDLALVALDKLQGIIPEDPDALAQRALILQRAGRAGDLRATLARLRQSHPDHPALARIAHLARLAGQDKNKLQQARMLAKSGQAEAALAALRALYPDGAPSPDLALEYWQLLGSVDRQHGAAQAGLSVLVRENPDNLRYRLALAQHQSSRTPVSRAAIATLAELARQPQVARQARAAWRSAVLRLEPSASSIVLIEQYLRQERTPDTAVQEYLDGITQARNQHRKLMADPGYRARLDGEALFADGKLDAAEDKLEQALALRPADPDVLGALGRLRLAQGHHAEAQAYFLQAQRLGPARRGEWTDLARTAQYWGLLREAANAADGGEFRLAEQKARQALALDPRLAAAWLALGRIYDSERRPAQAGQAWRSALRVAPSDFDALRALALSELRAGREADAAALAARVAPARRREFDGELDLARAALLREQADALLAQQNPAAARLLLERATEYDLDDPWLRLDLARLYAAGGERARGQGLFERLLERRPDDPQARYAFALFQSGQAQEAAALATLERVAPEERSAGMTRLQRRLWQSVVSARAAGLAKSGQGAAARRWLAEAESLLGKDRDLALALAEAQFESGDPAAARALMKRFEPEPASADWSLSQARLLVRSDADADPELAPLLQKIEAMPLSRPQKDALAELRAALALRRADALRRHGDPGSALQALAAARSASPDNVRLLYAEARLLRSERRFGQAEQNYRQLLLAHPGERDATAALIDTLIAAGQPARARAELERQLAAMPADAADFTADLAGSLIDLHDEARAGRLIEQQLERTPAHPRLLAYAGQLAQQKGDLGQAIAYLRHSIAGEQAQGGTLAAAAIASQQPANEPATLDYAQQYDSRYRRLALLLDRSGNWISSAFDKRTRAGSAGTSALQANELLLEWMRPQDAYGRLALQANLVDMRAGALDTAGLDGRAFGSTLLCQPDCGTGSVPQNAGGLALSAVLERDNLRLDIGSTPLGFPVSDMVGGILKKGDLGAFSYSVDASRRAVTGSVLSYAGTRDPRSGRVWGGVQATGLRLGLSHDDGGRLGAWSSLGWHQLSGKNVQSNERQQLMAGLIGRVINEEDRLLSVGMTGMLWRFGKNAGEYTYGHGGYYSPQNYKSLSLPVTYSQRHARFSYSVRAALSRSMSQTGAAEYFPTDAAMQAQARALAPVNGVDPNYAGGPGRGSGRSLALAWEYQVLPALFFGGRIDIERSPDYSPNRFLLFLRYAADRNSARPVNFPPQALTSSTQY